MKLRQYMDMNNITIKDLAEHMGVCWHFMHLIIKGKRNPGIQLAHQISQYTGGKVQVHEVRTCNKLCAPGCACSKGGNQ